MPARKRRRTGSSAAPEGDGAAALRKLTVAKLRAQLKKKGLDTSGKKAVLVERLAAALDEAAAVDTSLAATRPRLHLSILSRQRHPHRRPVRAKISPSSRLQS